MKSLNPGVSLSLVILPLFVAQACASTASSPIGSGTTGTSGSANSGGASGASGASGGSSTGASTGSSGTASGSSGAASGSGGASGSPSGDAGAKDASSAGADSASGTSCASLPLCDDFEQDTANTPPMGWTALMGCNPATAQNPSGTADGPVPGGTGIYVGIDSTVSHSGTNSLRIVGGDSCGYYAVNSAAFAGGKLGPQYYARMWAQFSAAPTSGHNGFLSMNTTSTASQNPDLLRLGFQNDVIEWNWYGSDATLPDTDSQGAAQSVAPSPNTWVCLEFHIDTTSGNIEFWYNGASVTTPGLSWNGSATSYQNGWGGGGWKSGIAPTTLGLGWGAFNGGMMTVWFDDVALGTSRIGCN